jgi:hypothetical protein
MARTTRLAPPDEEDADEDEAVEAAGAALVALERRARAHLRATLKSSIPVIVAAGVGVAHATLIVQRSQQNAIMMLRSRARAASADAFEAQTALATSAVTPAVAYEDALAASRASKALAARWAKEVAEAEAEALKAAAEEGGPYRMPAHVDLYDEATGDTLAALDRTATTETVSAWNDEWVRQGREYADDPDVTLVHEWNAALDACPRCWALNGTTVRDDETFVDGDPPLHPMCRCRLNTTVLQ